MKKKYYKKGEEFSKLAEELIDTVDNKLDLKRIDFMLITHRLLSKIYHAGSELPGVKGIKTKKVSSKQFRKEDKDLSKATKLFFKRMRRMNKLLGKKDYYWFVFNPLDKKDGKNPYKYSISGDLGEICQDLKKGLDFWKLDDPRQKQEAIWEWQFNWEYHWGDHALNAMKALHWNIQKFFSDYIKDDYDKIRNRYL